MTLVRLRHTNQIVLPRHIREAAGVEEGDYLEAEVTTAGTIVLRPVSMVSDEPTAKQEADMLAVVDEERAAYAAERRR